MTKPIRCVLGWHTYVGVRGQVSTDQMPWYLRCEQCGRERDELTPPPLDAAGG